MPTNKQRREAAQRHLQRQLDRRAELAKKRRRNMGIVAAIVAVLVVGGVILLGTGVLGGKDDSGSDAAASSSPAASSDTAAPAVAAAPSTNADGSVACDYAPAQGGDVTDVGTPPDADAVPAKGTVELTMATNQGDIGLRLDRAKAPCAAESFAFLAEKGFFDDTPCHRLVTKDTFGVLQCGDPSGSGSGGPSYRFAQEVTPDTTYPRGTIAMANSGAPGTTGSQFFLVFNDAQLPPDYSVVGTINGAGLKVLDKIAKAGDDGSFEPSPGGGKPKTPVQISSMAAVG